MSTRRTPARKVLRTAGLLLVAVALWAGITGYGVMCLVNPEWAIEDSSKGRGEFTTRAGAYLNGIFFIAIVNVPLAFAATWWVRHRRASRRPSAR